MKRFVSIALVLGLAFALGAAAQQVPAPPSFHGAVRPALLAATSSTQHSNTFSWTPSSDADATTTGNIYSVAGGCPTTLTLSVSQFTKLASNLPPGGPYVDLAVTANKTKSYVVTNVIGGVETGVSNCVSATTPNFPPQGLQVVSQ